MNRKQAAMAVVNVDLLDYWSKGGILEYDIKDPNGNVVSTHKVTKDIHLRDLSKYRRVDTISTCVHTPACPFFRDVRNELKKEL